MKKNLAKKITLSILAGAMLMSSSVVWAAYDLNDGSYVGKAGASNSGLVLGAGMGSDVSDSIAIGGVAKGESESRSAGQAVVIGQTSTVNSQYSVVIGYGSEDSNGSTDYNNPNSVVIGANSRSGADHGVVVGSLALAYGENSVALGHGSKANEANVVSVGSGSENGDAPATRKIINVATGTNDTDAVNVGQMKTAIQEAVSNVATPSLEGYAKTDDVANTYATKNEVNTALDGKANASDVYTKTEANNTFVKIESTENSTPSSGFSVVNTNDITKVTVTEVNAANSVEISSDTGITVGENSTRMDSTGFYAGGAKPHNYTNAKAAITEDGKIKGAGGAFEVDENGNVKANNLYNKTEVDTKLNDKADKATTLAGYGIIDAYTIEQVDALLNNNNADAIAGLNQRLEKTNAKINKVGAGAAALAALHPLDYDPDDKLTFSAGMGNYAGENAAALGAFYRPNEKFMVSLGGTMGNGENMVNLGLSIGLDKPNGYAKMSKRELIQEVNAVKAENDALEDRVAKLEALVAQLAKK